MYQRCIRTALKENCVGHLIRSSGKRDRVVPRLRSTSTMTSYLAMSVDVRADDHVLVDGDVWATYDRAHSGKGPIYVEMGHRDSGVFGRLCPGPRIAQGSVQIPLWMVERLGVEWDGEERWIGLAAAELPEAGAVVLRPATHATIQAMDDPVKVLTEALGSWSCLSMGAQLPLPCGAFDVVEVRSWEGYPVPAAAILNTDLAVDFQPAPDYVEPAPPAPIPEEPMSLSGILPAVAPVTKGFVPFSGKGRRLCDP